MSASQSLRQSDCAVAFKDISRDKGGAFRFRSVASTGNTDRDGESIDPTGWVMPKASVPLFFGHAGYRDVDNWIGFVERGEVVGDDFVLHNVIVPARNNQVGDKLADFVEFAVAHDLSVPGSVGFDPLAWTNRDGSKGTRGRGEPFPGGSVGRRYTSQELLEFSLVPVPSNTDSRVLDLAKAFWLASDGRTDAATLFSLAGRADRSSDAPSADSLTPFEKVCQSLGIPPRKRARSFDERLAEALALLREIEESAVRAD